jgi:carbonic anhydrase
MLSQDREASPLELSRRCFFPTAVAGMSFGSVAPCCAVHAAEQATPTLADDELLQPLTKAARDALTPDEVIARVKSGNERFRTGKKQHRDLLVELQRTAGGQWPEAVVLGCIDSRAPAEIIFDQGLGDIFNCRVAGNVESADMLGSIEFATKLAGAKLILILGHSACGAVKGAIAEAELGNLTQLLAKIRGAITETTYQGNRTADNPEFVDAVARKSVQLTMERMRKGSAVIAGLERSATLKIVGCFYDLSTGGIEFLEK